MNEEYVAVWHDNGEIKFMTFSSEDDADDFTYKFEETKTIKQGWLCKKSDLLRATRAVLAEEEDEGHSFVRSLGWS